MTFTRTHLLQIFKEFINIGGAASPAGRTPPPTSERTAPSQNRSLRPFPATPDGFESRVLYVSDITNVCLIVQGFNVEQKTSNSLTFHDWSLWAVGNSNAMINMVHLGDRWGNTDLRWRCHLAHLLNTAASSARNRVTYWTLRGRGGGGQERDKRTQSADATVCFTEESSPKMHQIYSNTPSVVCARASVEQKKCLLYYLQGLKNVITTKTNTND